MGKKVRKVVHAVVSPISFFVPKLFPSTEKLLNPLALAESLAKDPLGTIKEIGPAAMSAVALFAGAPPTFLPAEPGAGEPGLDPFSLLRFLPGGAPGIPGFPSRELTSADFIKATVEAAVQLAGVRGTIDTSVGGRLERLAGHQGTLVEQLARLFFPQSQAQSAALGGILEGVVGLVFPEMARSRAGWEHLIFGQFPAFGRTAGQSARYQGVRRDTVRVAAQRKWVPPEWARQRGIHNPDGGTDEEFFPGTEFEGLDLESWGALGTMVTGQIGEMTTGAIEAVPRAIIEWIIRMLQPLLQAGLDLGGFVGGQITTLAENTFGVAGERLLGSVADRLTRFGPVAPGQQEEVVRAALGSAFTMGLGAHAVASIAEMVMPLKHLGLPQLAAFMVDLAGFGAVAGAEVRPLVKWGIDVPADYDARRRFSSQLPDLGMAKQFVLERLIDLDTYAEVLRFNGFNEFWVDRYLKEVWEEPSLRELSTVVDDTPVDEGWLRQKVTETGLSDDDVPLFMEGLKRRANKSIRQAYMGSLQTAYKDGLLDEGELEGELERLNLNDEARELVRRRAGLERRRDLAGLWEQAFRALAAEERITLDDYRLALAGLGFQEDHVQVMVAVAEAKLTGRFAREERADLKRVIREEQDVRVRLAQESFRRGRVTQDQLFGMLVSIGIEEQQADAMVALEFVRVQPVPRLPVLLTPEAQRQQENEIIQEGALAAFREGKIDEATLARVLRSLEIPRRELEALVTLELARKDKPKPVVVREDPAVVRARQLKTEATIGEFRLKKVTLEQLRARLLEAGHPPVVVAGFVERELARVPLPSPPPAPAPPKEAPADRERRTILTQSARELFHQGVLDQAELENLLVNLGHPPETADAIATLEAIRAQGRPTRAPGTAS